MSDPKEPATRKPDPPASAPPPRFTAPPVQAAPAVQPVVPSSPGEPDPNSPYTGPNEIVPGGRYIQGAKLRGGKHYGGRIVNANGEVLAEFKDDQENTGNPDHGTKPEPEK